MELQCILNSVEVFCPASSFSPWENTIHGGETYYVLTQKTNVRIMAAPPPRPIMSWERNHYMGNFYTIQEKSTVYVTAHVARCGIWRRLCPWCMNGFLHVMCVLKGINKLQGWNRLLLSGDLQHTCPSGTGAELPLSSCHAGKQWQSRRQVSWGDQLAGALSWRIWWIEKWLN